MIWYLLEIYILFHYILVEHTVVLILYGKNAIRIISISNNELEILIRIADINCLIHYCYLL